MEDEPQVLLKKWDKLADQFKSPKNVIFTQELVHMCETISFFQQKNVNKFWQTLHIVLFVRSFGHEMVSHIHICVCIITCQMDIYYTKRIQFCS